MLKKTVVQVSDFLYEQGVIEEIDSTPKTDKKTKDRFKIQEEVFDDLDSIADNAKMISLLTSVVGRLWTLVPAADKDNLPPEEKASIDYLFSQFQNINTHADYLYALEGTELVDRLLARQAKIGNILK